MIRVFLCSVLLSQGLMAIKAHARPDMACDGLWSVDFIKDENYTDWLSYVGGPTHPASLKIDATDPKAVTFTDNHGKNCYVGYIADTENDWVVFSHCLPSYNEDEVPTHYKVRCKGDVLTGKIVSYKDGFKLKGTRVKD